MIKKRIASFAIAGLYLFGCGSYIGASDLHDDYLGTYGADYKLIKPYFFVDSKNRDLQMNVPHMVFKISKDNDGYKLYHWLAEPTEYLALDAAETGLMLDGAQIQLSQDKKTLQIDHYDVTAIRIESERWTDIEPHAISISCSKHMKIIGLDKGLTTYGELSAFATEYFSKHQTNTCRNNDDFYENDRIK